MFLRVVSRLYFVTAFAVILFFTSCEKETFYEDTDATLRFSVDTVYFDTVFTTFGTTTKWLKVYNPYWQSVKINSIQLAGNTASAYRLNIDGTAAPEVSNIIIQGRDSLFIFIEATIDPANQDSPLAVEDSIIFNTNGNLQQVKLLAWGQDVHLINGEILETQTWTSGKPYLVYNSMLVEEGHVLTIEAGARVYFHRNSQMYVAGTVKAMGNFENPIIFEGDRLEDLYKNIPGQWDGIWLMAGSENNEFHYAKIRNAINGIIADTLTASPNPTLLLANVIIENMTSAGIYARGSSVYAYNCLITSCGRYAVALTLGGNYEFYHCTIANYWNYSARRTPSVVLNNYYTDISQNIQIRPLEKALFGNCVIYGDKTDEIGFDFYPGQSDYDFYFNHCLVRQSESSLFDPLKYNAVLFNQFPGFVDMEKFDFSPDDESPAVDAGFPDYALLHPLDLLMNSRTADAGPDLGAFEKQQ